MIHIYHTENFTYSDCLEKCNNIISLEKKENCSCGEMSP